MQTERVQAADLERAEARLPQWMTAVGVAGTLLVLASGHGRLAAGFALGSVIGIVNYYWLHQAIATLFDVGYMNVAPPFIARPEGNEGTSYPDGRSIAHERTRLWLASPHSFVLP